jgi:hypothetical protein
MHLVEPVFAAIVSWIRLEVEETRADLPTNGLELEKFLVNFASCSLPNLKKVVRSFVLGRNLRIVDLY